MSDHHEVSLALVLSGNRNPSAHEHMAGRKVFYTIWNPTSPKPMVQTFDEEDKAQAVAEDMARRNASDVFFVMKSVSRVCVERPVSVVKIMGEIEEPALTQRFAKRTVKSGKGEVR